MMKIAIIAVLLFSALQPVHARTEQERIDSCRNDISGNSGEYKRCLRQSRDKVQSKNERAHRQRACKIAAKDRKGRDRENYLRKCLRRN
ncbi:MAG TPA: hypothetical protein VN361_04245 [Oxalicibacterium sp.]|nr:hypothetical protein [Oxalicibacterium sp.]